MEEIFLGIAIGLTLGLTIIIVLHIYIQKVFKKAKADLKNTEFVTADRLWK